jgi:hypothetical protein
MNANWLQESKVELTVTTLLRMHLRFALLLACLGLTAPMVFAQQPEKSFTVDELVAKNIEAKGGADALRAIQSVRFTGKLLITQIQLELGFVQIKKRPGEVRNEASIQGMTQVQASDGKEGWQISPFRGRRDPEKMSADDLKSLSEDAEIGGPLADWKAKGSKVEYLGTEDVDGTAAHKLKVTRKNGDVSFVYLDPDAFLEIRVLTQRVEHGAQIEEEKDLGDYEKVNGVYFPLSIETGAKGDQEKAKITFDKAEANVPLDDAMFRFPAKS